MDCSGISSDADSLSVCCGEERAEPKNEVWITDRFTFLPSLMVTSSGQ